MNAPTRALLPAFVVSLLTLAVVTNAQPSTEDGWRPDPERVAHWTKRRKGINFHESKVPDYTLPDPLVGEDGKPVTTIEDWNSRRRPELMKLFREHVYGVRPTTAYQVAYKITARRGNAFGIGATAQQVRATITANGKSHAFEFVFIAPKTDRPVPVVVLINNRYLIGMDKAIDEADPFWPVEKLVRKGYATASFHTSHVDPDKKDGYANGIRALLDDPESDPATRWRSISAWAWGASRVLDYTLAQENIDPKRTAVVGHSRGGKTALWAGAEDPRFTLVYSNNSGCGGAALSRRAYGETVARINRVFPHWFCERFNDYNDNEAKLPVDQHQLIALSAPRAVYVTSADEDLWADPLGEYTALVKAAPVFKLFKRDAVNHPDMPSVNKPRHAQATGYHIRTGKHNLGEQDWSYFLDFADKVFKPAK